MKHFKIITIIICSLTLAFYSCNENTKTGTQNTPSASKPAVLKETPSTPAVAPPLKEPAQNASGIWHYTCIIGCPGGAGLASNCENCGNVLTHNTRYHANPNNTVPSSAPFANTNTTPGSEPSQNTNGVWHYTCLKGCLSGAGSAIACNSCGEPLAHNTAYHN